MRLTITRKIILGIAVIVVLGVLGMLLIYRGLTGVRQTLLQLADVEGPLSSATHEMEINVNGLSLGVLRYLADPDERHRRLVEKDEGDFEAFQAQYLRLAETDQQRELGQRASRLFQQLRATARCLMPKRDEQERLLETVGASIEEIDGIIDNELQARIDAGDPDRLAKLEGLNSLEADLAEVNAWLAHYLRAHQAKHRQLITKNEQEFRVTLARVQKLRLARDERHWLGEVEKGFDQAMACLQKALALEDEIRTGVEKFLGLRAALDDLLDEEMQVLAVEHLRRPRQEADAAVSQVLTHARWLVPLFLLWALGVSFTLVRSITRPLTRLRQGTEAIGSGDLDCRITPVSRDELADLAEAFNRMAARLQTTTVSKGALEVSERQLQETVGQLRQEIAERQRAEVEQARLQASLRRAEVMSALGSLVAGVAHQVRNPLFGISSIVDAMDARFGEREEHRRYVCHLREQSARLTTLMQELLEYGKPLSQELTPAPLEEVIGEAVRACRPLADRLGVQVVVTHGSRLEAGLGPVAADRARLVRALEILLENALHYSPPGAVVSVEARPDGADGQAWVECAVVDAGPGFCPEDLPHVFEPFFTRRPSGTGLGLAIVQRIVEAHAGQVVAANRPGGGAVVTVRLPPLGFLGFLGGPPDGRGADPGD